MCLGFTNVWVTRTSSGQQRAVPFRTEGRILSLRQAMIGYKKWLVRFVEYQFDDAGPAVRADVARYLWRSAPVSSGRSNESFTLVLDLTNSPQTLLSKMHPNARYAIRRAEKDRFQYHFWSANDSDRLAEFYRFYDEFAATKGLPAADRQRLNAFAAAGLLDLSCAADPHGMALVWHAHYRGHDRVRLIHSASLRRRAMEPSIRALIGRANCYQTWKDLLRFQLEGISIYDLGGWYARVADREKLGINRFKANFGGQIVKEFSADIPLTAIGRLALAFRRRCSWRPVKFLTASQAVSKLFFSPCSLGSARKIPRTIR